MEREGVPRAAIETFRHYYDQLAAGESGLIPESDIDPVDDVPGRRGAARGRGAARRGGDHQAQRGPWHLDGDGPGEVAARGQGGALVPRRDRPPGARAARAQRGAAPARADELLLHARRVARRARALRVAGGRRPVRLRPAQGAQAAGRRADARRVAGRSRAGVVPAGARRHLHRAAHLGHAGGAARARLPLRLHVERRQSGSDARSAHPGLDRRRAAAVRGRADGAHGGRQEGRAPRPAQGGRRAGAARDRPDARRGPRRVHRRRAPSVLPHQQPVGRPAGARRAAALARRRARAADDREREDRRPGRRLDAGRLSARDGDGRGDRRVRRRVGDPRATLALRPGQEDDGPARAALRRVRADRRRPRRAGGGALTCPAGRAR